MAFPTSITSFTSPAITDYLNAPSHAGQHSTVNVDVGALETKLGIGASACASATDGYVMMADGAGNSAWEKIAPVLTTDADAATVTFNMNTSNFHQVTLGGNRTLAVSNVATGQWFAIRLIQDGAGSRTVTWWATIKWPSGTAPTLTTTIASVDMFVFCCTGAGTYDGYFAGFDLR